MTMKKLDLTTIISISAIAWIFLIISHEVIGHGGAAYINGGKLAYFDSMFARYIGPDGGFTFWQKNSTQPQVHSSMCCCCFGQQSGLLK